MEKITVLPAEPAETLEQSIRRIVREEIAAREAERQRTVLTISSEKKYFIRGDIGDGSISVEKVNSTL